MKNYDVVVLGRGPGGYIAAIRAAQLKLKTAIIEEKKLGGVCLNCGCIPTKAVLTSAYKVHDLKEFKSLGLDVELKGLDGGVAVKRAKKISERISKGVGFLMKKNKIDVIEGRGELESKDTLSVILKNKSTEKIQFKNLIIATGAHYRTFPGLEHDGKKLLGAWEAIHLEKLPKSVGIVGAGAIGVEFAYFWNAFGVDVHLFELQDRLLPLEDQECSDELAKHFKKYGIKTYLGVEKVSTKAAGKGIEVNFVEKGKSQTKKLDMGLIAVGMTGNIEKIGLEKVGIKTDRGFIQVDDQGKTNVANIFAIGDVAGPPLLAHAASHEGVIAAEAIAGLNPHPLDKRNIPGCTYCKPQVASVGYTERELKEQGISYKVGKLPFVANGKAVASNETAGFIKVLMGEYGEMLGAHIIGDEATELIHEYTLFRQMEGIDEEIFATVHPHPTLGEFLSEAVLNAKGRSLNF